MNNKKAIELSVNFLVTMVIALVTFGFAVSLVYSMFNRAVDIQEMSQDELNDRITRMACRASEKVCISNPKDIYNRGDLAIPGIFIYNIFSTETTFTIHTEFNGYIANGAEQIDQQPTNPPLLLTQDLEKKIKSNEQGDIGVGINVLKNTPSGQYIYTVTIQTTDPQNPFNEKRKIYINVK